LPPDKMAKVVEFVALPKQPILIQDALIQFEFRGTGDEARRNLVLQVDKQMRRSLLDIEQELQLGDKLCTVVKDGNVRAKNRHDTGKTLRLPQ